MTIDIDVNAIAKKIKKRTAKSQFYLNQQVIKDSNYYAPEDTGDLQDSAIIGSSNESIIWGKNYAAKQYYEDSDKSKDKNPNASSKWFEVAKSKNLKEWEKLANDKYND